MLNKYGILNGAQYFSSNVLQNYLVFILANKYFKLFSGATEIYLWKFKGIPERSIENITTTSSSFAPTLINSYTLPYVKFSGHCLINKFPDSGKVINLYISYTLNPRSRDLNTNFTLSNCLFKSVKLTKNAEPDKYVYNGYGIEFDSRAGFSLTEGSLGKNVIIFEVDMSSSVHIDNKNKDILIFGKGPTQGLDNTNSRS